MRFSCLTKSKGASQYEISFQGQINEKSNLEDLYVELLSRPNAKNCINLESIETINSSGVAKWIELIGKLEEQNLIEFVHCPIGIVQQMNMVPQFKGRYHVSSAFAPYYCAKCDKEHDVEIEIPMGAPQTQSKSRNACLAKLVIPP